jgi:hypothetical protein
MEDTKIKKRAYYRITPEQMASFEALEAMLGNGSAAARAQIPSIKNPGNRAWQLRKKIKEESSEQFIDTQLNIIAVDAVNRLGELVASDDEKTSLKAVMYSIDHIRGQATKKSIALTGKLNIQNVLD